MTLRPPVFFPYSTLPTIAPALAIALARREVYSKVTHTSAAIPQYSTPMPHVRTALCHASTVPIVPTRQPFPNLVDRPAPMPVHVPVQAPVAQRSLATP